MTKQSALLVVLLASACASLPDDPQVLGDQIIADLDAGLVTQAHDTFGRVERDAKWRESLYPVFFAEAQSRYEAGDFQGASVVLRFSVEEYSGAKSLREALLYSLFQLRAGSETLDLDLVQELASVVQGFRDTNAYSPWSDLIAAQTAIDLGQPTEALVPYQRFLAEWDGKPTELEAYILDIGRYIENPPYAGEEEGR